MTLALKISNTHLKSISLGRKTTILLKIAKRWLFVFGIQSFDRMAQIVLGNLEAEVAAGTEAVAAAATGLAGVAAAETVSAELAGAEVVATELAEAVVAGPGVAVAAVAGPGVAGSGVAGSGIAESAIAGSGAVAAGSGRIVGAAR